MYNDWRPKPGDRIFRPRRIKHDHLRRMLGVPALFSAGYGNVGSSIYYALGMAGTLYLLRDICIIAISSLTMATDT